MLRSMPKRSEDVPEEAAAYQQALARAIGGRIRARRRELGLSQEQLRTRLELANVYISRTQFSRMELGESLPNAAEIIALGDVLQRSCSWLLGGQAEPGSDDA